MIRRTKDEVLPQLPKKTIQIVPFELCKKTQKILKKEEWINIEDLKKYPERSKLGELAKIRQELALAKLPESIIYIKDLLRGAEKIVVFANHHTVLNRLMDELIDYKPVLFTGKQNEKTKQKAVDNFQNNPENRVFIGQIQAAGVGITLTAASTVVFVENTWVPSELYQAIDRLHRNGQENPVLAKILVVEESLDETILKTMIDKNKVIEKILG
jgi:SWI/SNF-related matrix-associated actin-dependent regulator 1 of chromatin subfamily A